MSLEEQLLEEISGYLHTYLKAGKMRLNTFLNKTNVNIDNLQQLLMVRFLLKEETMAFVEDLPRLLRNFKTTTTLKTEVNIGEVRGAINWPETIKTRLAQNYADPLTFSTTESIRSYDTPENLVLKELLSILHKVLYEDDYIKGFERASWFKQWKKLKPILKQVLRRNVYLQRVPIGRVSDRMVLKTCQHRNPLYKHAALLLAEYRKLMRGDYTEEELHDLLRETFIMPENIDVLFELYWVVQLIKTNTDASKLYLMDGRESLVASWEKDEQIYHLYHDSAGSRDIQFRIFGAELAGSDNPYVQRILQSFEVANEFADQFFQSHRSTYWQGRPDFLIEVREKETSKLVRLIIGEVKNTSARNYAITGMRELLDYMHLVKDSKGEYMYGEIPVEGILCIGDVEWNESAEKGRLVRLVNRERRDGVVV